MKRVTIAFMSIPLLFLCGLALSQGGGKFHAMKTLIVTSNSFTHTGMIPSRFTCDGSDVSPNLKWSGVPEGTKSFALLCDDPDAPVGDWVHWIVFNIPANVKELPENFLVKSGTVPGAKAGINDFRKLEYGGPCPPGGVHRYFFKVYALDSVLSLNEGLTKKELLKGIEGHVLGRGELMGKYTRKK